MDDHALELYQHCFEADILLLPESDTPNFGRGVATRASGHGPRRANRTISDGSNAVPCSPRKLRKLPHHRVAMPLVEGVAVTTEAGEALGQSVVAAKQGLAECAATRVLWTFLLLTATPLCASAAFAALPARIA